jgi:hypothetical protein
LKWGKVETAAPSVNTVQPEPKSAMKWGKQEKPSVIEAEPGTSFQSSSPGASSTPQVQAEGQNGLKKFNWGKN